MAKRGQWRINVNDVPNDIVIHRFMYEKTDFLEKVKLFKTKKIPDYLELKLNYDLQDLILSVDEAILDFGLHHFDYSNEHQRKSQSYISSSLTWNPHAIDKISENPHTATLGSTILKYGSAALYEEHGIKSDKNTYNDTFSFVEKTPFANHHGVKRFLDTFSRTLVRSRVSAILANQEEATKFDFSWHNDELVFVNLRVNIPLKTNPNYVIQIMSEQNENQLSITEFSMKEGNAYIYDTNKYHRPLCKKLNDLDRVHMICGVSPWFDYEVETNSWISNEYYGELHPFEMFEQGLITTAVNKQKF